MPTLAAFESETPFARDYAPFAVVWTRDQCAKLEAAGVLDYRYELIEGVIIQKMGQNRQHSLPVMRAIIWLSGYFDPDCLQTQASIYVASHDNAHNKPEPDLALLKQRLQDLPINQPRAEDVQFIIEVSDTTLDYDLGTKAGLYSRAGIAEYWVLSVEQRKLYIHTDPENGAYTRVVFDESATVAPRHALQATVRIADLLPVIPDII